MSLRVFKTQIHGALGNTAMKKETEILKLKYGVSTLQILSRTSGGGEIVCFTYCATYRINKLDKRHTYYTLGRDFN